MTERYLSNGLRALEAGSGEKTLILVPGWPQTAEAFLPVFSHLEPHYHLLAIDPPGLGRSAPPPDGNYSTLSVSKLMHEAVISAISSPYHLVGHDVGAWLAYPWAHQFEDSLLSVTFIDATLLGLAQPRTYPLPYDLNIKQFQFAFNTLPELPETLTAGRERDLLNWLFEHKAVHPKRISAEARDFYVKCYSQEGAMGRGFDYYRAIEVNMGDNKRLASEKKLGLPVIAISGSYGVGEAMRTATQSVSKGEVRGRVIDDCGHYVMEEQPEKTAGILLDAFREIRS